MSDILGYVVVEWTHAGEPNPNNGMALGDLSKARMIASIRQAGAKLRGRGERYTVHAVTAEEIEEGT